MVGGENWLSIQFIMLRRVVNFVLFLFVATVCYRHLCGADLENDALDEAEAKRDMMAYVQSTFPRITCVNIY